MKSVIKPLGAVIGDNLQEINARNEQLNRLRGQLRNLKDQLSKKEQQQKDYIACYDQLISSMNGLNTMIENTRSAADKILAVGKKIRFMNKSHTMVVSRLGNVKLIGAQEELKIEKRKLYSLIEENDVEIDRLNREIGRKEKEIWRLEHM